MTQQHRTGHSPSKLWLPRTGCGQGSWEHWASGRGQVKRGKGADRRSNTTETRMSGSFLTSAKSQLSGAVQAQILLSSPGTSFLCLPDGYVTCCDSGQHGHFCTVPPCCVGGDLGCQHQLAEE